MWILALHDDKLYHRLPLAKLGEYSSFQEARGARDRFSEAAHNCGCSLQIWHKCVYEEWHHVLGGRGSITERKT